MMNRKYSVIVFDLGNVLIPFDYNTLIKKLDLVKPGLGKHFIDTYFNNYNVHRAFESGKMTESEFISKMLQILENKIDGVTFCNYFSDIFTENSEVTALLPELKKKFKLVLLSNTNSIHEEYGWKNYNFLKYFDNLVLSHKAGSVKPEEAIYREVERLSGFPSNQHIFIDDIEDYVLAAKKIGWDGIQFKGHSSLIEEFRKRNII
jgi:putative hydrolase of the HAD superfamily